MEKIVLIDGNSILFRAYFATVKTGAYMKYKAGVPTNALFGFVNMFEKMIEISKPDYLLVAFDAGKKTFRHEKYDVYKDGRSQTPDDLIAQFSIVEAFLKAYNVKSYKLVQYEADDIIGTMSKIAVEKGIEVEIYSSDKDLLQLVNDHVTVFLTKKGITDLEKNDPQMIKEKYDLTPNQIIDLKGLMGDPSDNIPGIPGIGEKTALKLLWEYGSVESVVEHSHELKGKLKEKVETHQELGLMSKQIATIECESPITISLDELKVQPYQHEELMHFYQQYDLNALMRRIDIKKPVETNIEIVTKMPVLKDKVALHAGILGANYHRGLLYGFAVYTKSGAYFISEQDARNDEVFLAWLKSGAKIGYDIKRQMLGCKWNGIDVGGFTFDLKLASYVLDPSIKDDFKVVCSFYGYEDVSYDETIYGKKDVLPEIETAANHLVNQAKAIYQLEEPSINRLKEANQYDLYEMIEFPLASILKDMEFQGITIDVSQLKHQGESLLAMIKEIEIKIYEYSGTHFNIGSPKQLGEVLFEKMNLPSGKKTKTGYSTSADILEKLMDVHPIIKEIMDYRQYTKLYSTYIDGLQKEVFDDGKIHTIYNQALTQTGRLSSSDPNLQNIPVRLDEGRLIRRAFTPSKQGWVILGVDYSQIELRILAHIAGATEMIEAFNEGLDIHTKTAMDIFHVEKEEVTSLMRRQAKAINFGIVYGMSDFGLSTQLGIPVKEAHQFIHKYFETFPSIKAYMDGIVDFCKHNEYVETLFNRKRFIPSINSKNFMEASGAKRLAMNTPIQGSAADLLKIAMIKVDKAMKDKNVQSKMLLQVHDELVFEVPLEELETMIELVTYNMENAYPLSVKISCEHAYGPTWYDAK